MITALSLRQLIDDNAKRTNYLSLRSKVTHIKTLRKDLFAFLVKSDLSYSSPYGHISVISFDRRKLPYQLLRKDIKVGCTCPAFLWWGNSYNATKGKYARKLFKTNIPPNIRDPHRIHKICKHLVALRPILANKTMNTFHKYLTASIDPITIKTIPHNHSSVLKVLEFIGYSVSSGISVKDFENILLDLMGIHNIKKRKDNKQDDK